MEAFKLFLVMQINYNELKYLINNYSHVVAMKKKQ